MRDGRAEPRGRKAYLKQYVDRLSGEPARRQVRRQRAYRRLQLKSS